MRGFWEVAANTLPSLNRISRSNVFPLRRRFQRLHFGDDLAEMRRQIREACAARPGVYGFLDRAGSLVYVGVSSKLRSRLATYFQGGAADRKERAVANQATQLIWQIIGHEFAAQLRELELIRRFQPRLNVRGRWPGRPLGYVYLSEEAAPRFRIARLVPKTARHGWGPVAVGGRVREAVETLNRVFQLPDCPTSVSMHFADQRQLFPLELRFGCLRGETGSCLGPCAGGCSHADYATQIAAARALLDGRDDRAIVALQQRLAAAVAAQQFEQAARLRDTLESLETLLAPLAKLRVPPVPDAFVYPITIGRHAVWYFIAGGVVVAARKAPQTQEDAKRCLAQWELTFRRRISPGSITDRAAAQIVSAWFQSRPGECDKILLPRAARRCCQKSLAA